MSRPAALAGGIALLVLTLLTLGVALELESRRRAAELDRAAEVALRQDRAWEMSVELERESRSWLARLWPPYRKRVDAAEKKASGSALDRAVEEFYRQKRKSEPPSGRMDDPGVPEASG